MPSRRRRQAITPTPPAATMRPVSPHNSHWLPLASRQAFAGQIRLFTADPGFRRRRPASPPAAATLTDYAAAATIAIAELAAAASLMLPPPRRGPPGHASREWLKPPAEGQRLAAAAVASRFRHNATRLMAGARHSNAPLIAAVLMRAGPATPEGQSHTPIATPTPATPPPAIASHLR